MSDNVKLTSSEGEIASRNEIVIDEDNSQNPEFVTDKPSIEGGNGAASEVSSVKETATRSSEDTYQPTSSEGGIKLGKGVEISTSDPQDSKSTSKIRETPESKEMNNFQVHNVGNEGQVRGDTEGGNFKSMSKEITRKMLPSRKLEDSAVLERRPISRRNVVELSEDQSSQRIEESLPTAQGKDRKVPPGEFTEESEEPSRLVIVQRLSRLPVVRCSAGVYQKAKANQLLGGLVALMEFCAWLSTRPLALSSSLTSSLLGGVCSTPVGAVDWMLCKGLDAAQAVCPCVAVPPSQMCGVTVHCARDCMCCGPRLVASGINCIRVKAQGICIQNQ